MKKVVLFCFVIICAITNLRAQNISGIINTYTQVTGISANINLTVSSAAGFSIADKVLIMQMKGAMVNQTNTINYGDINGYNNAGNYEYGIIAAVNSLTNVITLQFALCRSYTPADVVQLIRVPVYTNVTVSGTLSCQPWNGTTGGVLVFEASGTVTMAADINVSENGFLGGAFCSNFFGCGSVNFFSPATNCNAGKKGEGIAQFVLNQEQGRGHLANGGGGSESGNNGGGGGANFADGGIGGNEYSGCATIGIQGMPGENLNYTTNRIFMGGGGGGGFADNSLLVTPGGDGGGIVLIKATVLDGNNFSIRSNGESVTTISNDESAGGGGAGGSVFMNVGAYSSLLNVEAKGGDGGSTYNNVFIADCHGTGGGGSGGILWLTDAALPANVTFTATGGLPGLVLNPSSSCYNTSWGAAAGVSGGTQFNLDQNPILLNLNLGNDTAFCNGGSITLNAGSGFATYLWQNGSTDSTFTVTASGTYYVTVTNGSGCSNIDSITVGVNALPQVNLGNDTTVCAGSLILNGGSGFSSYLWSTTDTTQTITVTQSGLYSVLVSDNIGCTNSDQIIVTVNSIPSVNLGNDTSFCVGGSIVIDAGGGFASYLWSTTDTSQSITINQSGTYSVQVSDTNGCTNSDQIIITVIPPPLVSLGNDTSFCSGGSVVLNAGLGFASYLWSTTAVSQIITVNQSGLYSVLVADNNGCTNTSQVNVTVNQLPSVSLGNDTSFCSGGSIVLNAGGGFTSYLWSTTAISQTITVNQSGLYSVQVTDNNGCTNNDQISITVNQSFVISLGNDTSVCQGAAVMFDAGAGFSNYLWQDGSGNQTFSAADAGIYYVSVTDNNSCKASDTVIIVSVFAAPVVQLGSDTMMCDIDLNPLVLDAGNGFASYLWQDNSSSQTFSAANFGTYTVTVIDQNGCRGNDSFAIEEQCESVFSLPNVFTPNDDNHNESFKPEASDLKSFNMEIFNRWGQKLFESSKPDVGWDGTNKGSKCAAGTYFYVVGYSGVFDGAASSKTIRGHLTLIR